MPEFIEIGEPTWGTYRMLEYRGKDNPVWVDHPVINGKISGRQLLLVQLPEYQRPPESEAYRRLMIKAVYGRTMEPLVICCRAKGGTKARKGGKDIVKLAAEVSFLGDGQQRKLLTGWLYQVYDAWVVARDEWAALDTQGKAEGPAPEQPRERGILIDDDIEFDVRIFFACDPDWEVEQFDDHNAKQKGVKPLLLVRNKTFIPKNSYLKALYQVSKPPGNLSWAGWLNWGEGDLIDPKDKRQRKGITNLSFLRMQLLLYRNFGVRRPTKRDDIIAALQQLAVQIDPDPEAVKAGSLEGVHVMIENAKAFTQFMDGSFKVSAALQERHLQADLVRPQTSSVLHRAVALVLGTYPVFWDGYRLAIPRGVQGQLAEMKLGDRAVSHAIGQNSNQGVVELAVLMVKHLNGSKTKNTLDPQLVRKPPKGKGFLSKPAAVEVE